VPSLPLIFVFWAVVAAYVVHVIDESLLGGSFVEKVRAHWWPEYSWRKFAWFNAGYFALDERVLFGPVRVAGSLNNPRRRLDRDGDCGAATAFLSLWIPLVYGTWFKRPSAQPHP
jgi:hypothetical protein